MSINVLSRLKQKLMRKPHDQDPLSQFKPKNVHKSPDERHVLFSTEQRLSPEDTNDEMDTYLFDTKEKKATFIPGHPGKLQWSEDGKELYTSKNGQTTKWDTETKTPEVGPLRDFGPDRATTVHHEGTEASFDIQTGDLTQNLSLRLPEGDRVQTVDQMGEHDRWLVATSTPQGDPWGKRSLHILDTTNGKIVGQDDFCGMGPVDYFYMKPMQENHLFSSQRDYGRHKTNFDYSTGIKRPRPYEGPPGELTVNYGAPITPHGESRQAVLPGSPIGWD